MIAAASAWGAADSKNDQNEVMAIRYRASDGLIASPAITIFGVSHDRDLVPHRALHRASQPSRLL
jgi:hypothetical protein